jgi:hypothetical protein
MKLMRESPDAGVAAIHAFLALGAVALVAIIVLLIATMSGPEKTSPVIIIPGIDINSSGPTITPGPANVTDSKDVTPTPGPHKLRIVVAEGSEPTPTPTPVPDAGMVIDGDEDKSARHIAYAFQPNVTGLTDFTARWTIPQRPLYNGGPKHTIFLWMGIQQGTSGLIQAVLEWDHDHTGKYWTLACWIVNAKEQTYEVSPRIDAYPGDRVMAELHYEDDPLNPGQKVWRVTLTDETRECFTELIDDGRAVDANRDILVFSGVLKGIGAVSDGDDLPGDLMFGDITYKDENGENLPVYLTGYVDPKFRHVAVEHEDGPSGSPVIIRTNYTAENTGT